MPEKKIMLESRIGLERLWCAPGGAARLGCRSRARLVSSALTLVLVCAACGESPEGNARGAAAPQPAQQVTLQSREGAETVLFRPFTSPEGFPLPFTTRLPDGFEVRPRLEDGADAIALTWHQGEPRSDSALIYLVVLPPEEDEESAREIVRTAAERVRVPGDQLELEPIRQHPWAIVEYPIRSRGTLAAPLEGWVALGREQDRWFYFIVQAGSDAWPRFEPRAERVLEEWRWIDSGRALTGP